MLQCLRGTYLSLGWHSDESLVVVGESDNRWGSSLTCIANELAQSFSNLVLTFSIFDDFGVVSFHDGDAGVGGSQINSNDATEHTD